MWWELKTQDWGVGCSTIIIRQGLTEHYSICRTEWEIKVIGNPGGVSREEEEDTKEVSNL